MISCDFRWTLDDLYLQVNESLRFCIIVGGYCMSIALVAGVIAYYVVSFVVKSLYQLYLMYNFLVVSQFKHLRGRTTKIILYEKMLC